MGLYIRSPPLLWIPVSRIARMLTPHSRPVHTCNHSEQERRKKERRKNERKKGRKKEFCSSELGWIMGSDSRVGMTITPARGGAQHRGRLWKRRSAGVASPPEPGRRHERSFARPFYGPPAHMLACDQPPSSFHSPSSPSPPTSSPKQASNHVSHHHHHHHDHRRRRRLPSTHRRSPRDPHRPRARTRPTHLHLVEAAAARSSNVASRARAPHHRRAAFRRRGCRRRPPGPQAHAGPERVAARRADPGGSEEGGGRV